VGRLIKRLKKDIRQKRFYYRLLFFYTVLGVVIISAVTGISFSLLGKRYEQEIRRSNSRVLEQVAYFTDEALYGTVTQMINDYILIDYSEAGISRFYSPNAGFTNYDCYKYHQLLIGLVAKNDFVHSITIYRKNPNYVVDSRYGLGMDPNSRFEDLDRLFPFSDYCNLALGEERIQMAAPLELGPCNWPYLTVLRRIPLYGDVEEMSGYFAVAFEPDVLWEKISGSFQFQGSLLIMDETGKLILSNMPDSPETVHIQEILNENFFRNGETYYDFHVGGIKYDVTSLISGVSGWRYISVTPTKTLVADSIAANRMVLLISAVLTVLSFFIIKLISGKMYKPLDTLRSHAVKNGGLSDVKDDITAINDVLSFFEEKVDDMQNTIAQNAEVLIYKSLMDILYNQELTEEETVRRLTAAGLPAGRPLYLSCILITEIDSNVFFSLNMEQQEYMAARFRAEVEEWCCQPSAQVTEFRQEGRIITLLCLPESMYLNLMEGRRELLELLQEKLHVNMNIFISTGTKQAKELSQIYKETAKYLKYRYLYGFGNIFIPEELEEREERPYLLDTMRFHEFEACLRSGRFEEAERILGEWEAQIIEGRFSVDTVQSFMMQICNLCRRTEAECHLLKDEALRENAFAGLETADFRRTAEMLRSCLLLFREESGKNGDSRMIRNIMDYVCQNCEKELTLTAIAEKFGISPGHLSRTFKAIAGCNLSVYIVDCKLEKAADYLRKNSEWTTAQVAEKLGYYTPAYFTRLFKAKYGMTPFQYQKLNRPEREEEEHGKE